VIQDKLRVGVVFGSCSCEYEVSLNSAASVIANLDADKYEVISLAITREGKWLLGVELAELPSRWRRQERARTSRTKQSCYIGRRSKCVQLGSFREQQAG
jgi:D-alanine-D-alanine ligase-like ATP-grasp enzyme